MTEPHHLVTHIDQEISARGAARPPLRVGIMVDSLSLTGWVAKIITDIQKSSIAQVVLVVRNAAPARPREKSLRKRLKTYWTHSLFERYRRWDR